MKSPNQYESNSQKRLYEKTIHELNSRYRTKWRPRQNSWDQQLEEQIEQLKQLRQIKKKIVIATDQEGKPFEKIADKDPTKKVAADELQIDKILEQKGNKE